jgi:transcription elongation factor Elf1
MPLTDKEYVAKGGNFCPHCGSTDIVGGEVEIGTGTAMQGVSCSECEAAWVDQYKLVGFETIEEPPACPPTANPTA